MGYLVINNNILHLLVTFIINIKNIEFYAYIIQNITNFSSLLATFTNANICGYKLMSTYTILLYKQMKLLNAIEKYTKVKCTFISSSCVYFQVTTGIFRCKFPTS